MSEKDYYKILGIDKKASKDEVKKAFRTLAQKHHPDKGGDESRFKEISEAYSVLGDDKKRAEYDAYGRVFGAAGGSGQGGGYSQGGAWDFSDFAEGFGFEDIFGDFGNIFTGGGADRTRRGRDISIDLQIAFKDSVFGAERKVLLRKATECKECEGTGAKTKKDLITCDTCNGRGQVRETRNSFLGSFTTVRSCSVCHGSGKVPKEKCKTCKGAGVTQGEEEIKVTIPPGIEDGEMIRFNGGGEAIPGGVPGDLYIKIHVEPHAEIKKEGNNLLMPLNVKLTDAILGSTYTVDTLDGAISVKIPAGISHGELLRVKGKGVPFERERRGDLLLRVSITIPQKLSRKAKKLFEELQGEGI